MCLLACVFTQTQTKLFSEKKKKLYNWIVLVQLVWTCDKYQQRNWAGRMWKSESFTVVCNDSKRCCSGASYLVIHYYFNIQTCYILLLPWQQFPSVLYFIPLLYIFLHLHFFFLTKTQVFMQFVDYALPNLSLQGTEGMKEQKELRETWLHLPANWRKKLKIKTFQFIQIHVTITISVIYKGRGPQREDTNSNTVKH